MPWTYAHVFDQPLEHLDDAPTVQRGVDFDREAGTSSTVKQPMTSKEREGKGLFSKVNFDAFSKMEGPLWPALCGLIIGLVVLCSLFWIYDHPHAISWDDAEYFNRVLQDRHHVDQGASHFLGGGLIYFAGSMLLEDRYRPPAFRILVGPFVYLFGFSPSNVRLVSLGFFAVSLIFVYLAARRIAGPAAGAFAASFLSLCPDVIFSSMNFGTEYPLYLATAAMFYFLFRDWGRENESPLSWTGLGISLGLGALAKTSFLLIGPAAWLLSLILSWRRIILRPSATSLLKAAVLGVLLAGPWWIFNFAPALSYAQYSRAFVRHSMGASFSETLLLWLESFAVNGLGPPLVILSVLAIVAMVLVALGKIELRIDRVQRWAVIVAILSALPLLLLQPLGPNQNMRYITPSLFPLSVGMGVLATSIQWTTGQLRGAVAGTLFGVQLMMISAATLRSVILPLDLKFNSAGPPWLVMARLEQWDWNPLRELSRAKGIQKPSISHLGNGRCYNPPQIMYPWFLHHEKTKDETWLWRYEEGPIDWDKINKSLDESDIVLTAPNYIGEPRDRQDLDNQHNREFANMLEKDSRFTGPVRLRMGRFAPTEILVFFKKAVAAER
jgi:Dolichyl-phosphate-mannose-protein mannosyltransferase